MILHGCLCGKVGRRRDFLKKPVSKETGFFAYTMRSIMQNASGLSNTLFFDPSQVTEDESGTMSALAAAESLLTEIGKPLGYVEITKLILKKRLWVTEGRTPEATINAQLAVEIKKNGKDSRFQRTAPGVFALRSWGLEEYIYTPKHSDHKNEQNVVASKKSEDTVVPLDLSNAIQQHNQRISDELHAHLFTMAPNKFEILVGELLTALGFEVEVTSYHSDGGIDVKGTLVVGGVTRTKMAVQVKRWKNNVQTPTVQQVRGSLEAHDQGLIITTGGFSSGAKQEAMKANAIPISLMGGEQFVRLLIENNMGVRKTRHDLLELDLSATKNEEE